MADFYLSNRQKLFFMVSELHKRGFEKLHVVPSLSPSGCHWRCSFVMDGDFKTQVTQVTASNWIYYLEGEDAVNEIKFTPKELADLFEKENFDFLKKCKGRNKQYMEWFSKMLDMLEEGELPYGFPDDFSSTDYWETSKFNKIKVLPEEKDYC